MNDEDEKALCLRITLNLIFVAVFLLSIFAIARQKYLLGTPLVLLCIFLVVTSLTTFRTKVVRCDWIKNKIVLPALEKRDEWLLQKIEHLLTNKTERILNFGCGLNSLSKKLTNMGHSVIALDVTNTSIADTPVVIYNGDIIPNEIGTFDTAIVLTVLHHIPRNVLHIVLQQLTQRCKRIIVLEDVVTDTTFTRTALKCLTDNWLFFDHPFQFKKHDTWKQLFERYGEVTFDQTGGQFSVFEVRSYGTPAEKPA